MLQNDKNSDSRVWPRRPYLWFGNIVMTALAFLLNAVSRRDPGVKSPSAKNLRLSLSLFHHNDFCLALPWNWFLQLSVFVARFLFLLFQNTIALLSWLAQTIASTERHRFHARRESTQAELTDKKWKCDALLPPIDEKFSNMSQWVLSTLHIAALTTIDGQTLWKMLIPCQCWLYMLAC